jgi:GAF domain-containing protein
VIVTSRPTHEYLTHKKGENTMDTKTDERRLRLVTALAELPGRLSADDDPSTVAATITSSYRSVWEADWCRVWWSDLSRQEARVIGSSPEPDYGERWQYYRDLSATPDIVAKAILIGNQRIERDATKVGDAVSGMAKWIGAKSGSHTPLIVQGKSRGNLTLVSTQALAHFTDDDIPLLQAAAGFLAAMLELSERQHPEWDLKSEPVSVVSAV